MTIERKTNNRINLSGGMQLDRYRAGIYRQFIVEVSVQVATGRCYSFKQSLRDCRTRKDVTRDKVQAVIDDAEARLRQRHGVDAQAYRVRVDELQPVYTQVGDYPADEDLPFGAPDYVEE